MSKPLRLPTRLCLLAVSLALLAGCMEPMIRDSDVIRHATEPAYGYDERGQIQATSCRPDRPSTYSGTPSACVRDVAFAKQVFSPADLVDPRRPGPAPAGPPARQRRRTRRADHDPRHRRHDTRAGLLTGAVSPEMVPGGG